MFSILTITSIFTEIFSAGVLAFGFIAVFKKYFEQKQKKDLFLGCVFFLFAFYVGLMLASQLLYNLGSPISLLILLQRIIAFDLILNTFFLLLFVKHKFALKSLTTLFFWFYGIISFFLCYNIMNSSVSLIYRVDVIEPIVVFSLGTPIRIVWLLSWLVFMVISVFYIFKQKGNDRVLLSYDALAAFLICSSFVFNTAYITTQNGYYLFASWIAILFGVVSLTLAENIPKESYLAANPLNFFRSRILFKLIFIFVLIIVVLFEITTLVTLTLSKQALKKSIFLHYEDVASEVANKIEALPGFDKKTIQKIIDNTKPGRNAIVFVVDRSGNVIVHPDKTRAASHINMSNSPFVKKALMGYFGAGQFKHPEFSELTVDAYYPIKNYGGAVIVEEPLRDAYYELRQLETNSLLFVIAGILLTVFTGIYLAQSIEGPIHKLKLGTESISAGDLDTRIDIDSIDEIGLLAQAFNKMAHHLKDSRERLILSEKLAALGTMAAGMAHEIKNPLVSLRTFSQLLLQKWQDPEFRLKFAQIVPNEIERINKIAESLLKFGRPSKPEMGKVNVNLILDEILLLFESECKKNGIRVSTKFTTLPEIVGDSQQLSQAFVNIILNAIQSMEKGGELVVKTDIGEVVYFGHQGKGAVDKDGSMIWGQELQQPKPIKSIFVEVSDSGVGITQDNMKSLFDPFFTTKAKGTGMGLPVTLRIIEEHKGSIKVKSVVGKGTSFIITLPQKFFES